MKSEASHRRVFYVTARGASARSFLMGHLKILQEAGYEPYLVCSEDAEADEVVKTTGVCHLPVALSVNISFFADIRALLRLVIYMVRVKPYVVHGHMSKASFASLLAATLVRVPVRVYHNHGMACFSSSGFRKTLLELIEKITCRIATHIVFCSESTRTEAINTRLCAAEKSQVLGMGTISGIDVNRFSPQLAASQAALLRNELQLPTTEKKHRIVIFVGRIVPHKGIDMLLDAWRELPADIRQCSSLIIAGANEGDALYDRLNALVESDQSVTYLGRLNNIVGLYGLADILILPSWHEGFPYSVLEAQACGLPAIVTRVTGNVDAVVEGETGLFVEKGDVIALAKLIAQLSDSPTYLEHMSKQAGDRVLREFKESHVLSNLMDFYRSLEPIK